MDKKKQLPLFVVAVLVLSAGSFFLGRLSASSSKTSLELSPYSRMGSQQFASRNGSNIPSSPNSNQSFRGGFIGGQIISMDSSSFNMKLDNGGSMTVYLSPNSVINLLQSASSSDLSIGQSISVSGSTNKDGSLTARTVQIKEASFTSMPNLQQGQRINTPQIPSSSSSTVSGIPGDMEQMPTYR